jgi:prepilin-type N-terminal cleavage/methylation domain-containing protein
MKKGFTLVELIVVITILAILSTVWFVSYVDYLRWVRDSNRAHQLATIHNAIDLYATRSKIPLPNNGVSVTFWSAWVWTQGDIDQSVLDKIKYSDGGRDPKTKDFFSYFVSKDRKYAQILWYFEEENSQLVNNNNLYADGVDYSSYFPKVYGSELGILLDSVTNRPLHKADNYISWGSFDIETSTWTLISYQTSTDYISGTWNDFIGMVPNTNCGNVVTLLWTPESGVYKINPSGTKPIDVYCEMDDDNKWYGDWWTLVARSHEDAITGDFGWLVEVWNVYNDTKEYSLWSDVKDIRFSQILFTTYDTGKNITTAVKFDVEDELFFPSEINSPDSTLSTQYSKTENCEILYDIQGLDQSCYRTLNRPDRPAIEYWGAFGRSDSYVFNRQTTDGSGFMHNNMFRSDNNSMTSTDSLRWKYWMLFIR